MLMTTRNDIVDIKTTIKGWLDTGIVEDEAVNVLSALEFVAENLEDYLRLKQFLITLSVVMSDAMNDYSEPHNREVF